MMVLCILLTLIRKEKSIIMSGIKKHSTDISKEVEISLEIENSIPKIIPKPATVEPEYYECDDKYTTFE